MSSVLAKRRLIPHSDFPCPAVETVGAKVTRAPGGAILIDYVVTGRIAALRLPPPAAPAQTDELWRHTCFEAFVADDAAAGYLEYNLAPSSAWATYRFDAYRAGMRAATVTPPSIAVSVDAARLTLAARLDLPNDGAGRLGLSAVIEDRQGNLSYWALAHPQGAPDFHHGDCFVLRLPAAIRS